MKLAGKIKKRADELESEIYRCKKNLGALRKKD